MYVAGGAYDGDWLASPSPTRLPQRDVHTHDSLLVGLASFPGSPSFRAIIPHMTFDPPEGKECGSKVIHARKEVEPGNEARYVIHTLLIELYVHYNSITAKSHCNVISLCAGILRHQVVLTSPTCSCPCLSQSTSCSAFLRGSEVRPLS